MINDNRKYDTSALQRNERNRNGSSNIAALQKVFVTLALTSVVLGLVILGIAIGKKGSGDTVAQAEGSGVASLVGVVETPTPTVPFVIPEYLTESATAVSMWGEFTPAANPIPYEHVPVQGLYIGAAFNLQGNLDLAASSAINSVVIDLKEAEGVLYNSSIPLALQTSTVASNYDLSSVCEQCHASGVRVIGRIVCFKDPRLAEAYPDRAICDSAGNILHFSSEGEQAFLNPYNPDNWSYLIDIAKEAISMGVDEIQFDYVRFPTGSSVEGTTPYFGLDGTVPERYEAINRFIRTARVEIQDTMGIPISCDVFGIVVTSELDGSNLGQDWMTVGLAGEDSVCPMIYPSHYALGTMIGGITYDKPDLQPYEIMNSVLNQGSAAWHQDGYAVVRPYVQAFTASYIGEGNYMDYGYDAINSQIRAIQDAGLDEYILWNAGGVYPSGNYGGNNG
ncbi:MAG: hypothetical protein J6127_07145 [Clostridiales bacterium]|nr:hypothetical protein [Clostridiales bacterium]